MTKINTKERILHTAKELFYAQGYINTTIRQIQKGANNHNIHYYFKNKNDFGSEIYEQYLLELRKNILNYNIPELDDRFLLYFVLHIQLYEHILKDPNNRRYYLESMNECKAKYIEIVFDKEFDQILDIAKKNTETVLTRDMMKYYGIIVLSCQEGILTNTLNGTLNFSLDELIIMLLKLIPQLFGVSDKITDLYLNQAQIIASRMDLNHIRLLV